MTRPQAKDWILRALQEYERPLVAFAARRLGGDVERARDVVQDVFLKLCRADRDQVETHLKEWLYTVCRNRLTDLGRQEGRMRTTRTMESAAALDARADHKVPAPSARLEQAETQSTVLAGLELLPEKQREALRLKFQQGLSYAEISRITETSVGTVGWLIHHGLKNLKERLAPRAADLGVPRV